MVYLHSDMVLVTEDMVTAILTVMEDYMVITTEAIRDMVDTMEAIRDIMVDTTADFMADIMVVISVADIMEDTPCFQFATAGSLLKNRGGQAICLQPGIAALVELVVQEEILTSPEHPQG